MPRSVAPLLFPQALNHPGLWVELGKVHGLTDKDFNWLSHVLLLTETSRQQQTPPMTAKVILLNTDASAPVPLAGCFALSATPDDNGTILYTPYDGITKHHSRAAMVEHLETRLKAADSDDDLFAFLAISQRKQLLEHAGISLSFKEMEGGIFDYQKSLVRQAQRLNTQAMLDELKRLPSLRHLLEVMLGKLLAPAFAGLDQRHTRVNLFTEDENGVRPWQQAMSLADAVLLHYRHRQWPPDQKHEFFNPSRKSTAADQVAWENAVTRISGNLSALLADQMEQYWQSASADGSTRRDFFAQAIRDQARADLLLKREDNILDAGQFNTLHQIIKPAPSSSSPSSYRPTFETVRIWEYPAHYVELAGSLMISHQQAYLYTPSEGIQVLTDYQDLRSTLLSKFSAPGHEDELFGLLSLEERKRFIGFHAPQVTGELVSGDLFRTLFDHIVGKQQQNIHYALQVFRHSDGAIDIHALFDSTIDTRLMINRDMTRLDTGGRWSTQPVLTGNQQPSMVQAEKAAAAVKTYTDIETTLRSRFMAQPNATPEQQRAYLENLKPDVAHAMYVGLGGEARQRVTKGTLQDSERAIVEAVVNADLPTRRQRAPINGFRPDAYWLTLQSAGQTSLTPLAQCMLITERGGLDAHYSGRAILWTPAMGLEVFNNIDAARQAINQRLLDNVQRLSLLENLAPKDFQPNRRYTLGPLHQITDNVLHHSAQSAINHYLGNFAQVRERIKDQSRQTKALTALSLNVINTNLNLAAEHAQAIRQQQTLPAWFGMAPVAEQKRHVELLEQWRCSVPDDKDYLDGVESLASHVRTTLRNLLDLRIPGHGFSPDQINVVPNLALAGPPLDLVNFALNHISVGQNTGFSLRSATDSPLPDTLDQSAVTQLLLSLNIATGYAEKITQALTTGDQAAERRQRFYRQLPWQLLQHAHAMKLQQSLSTSAFDCILQVLDMPDGLARSAVEGANAFVSPLTLVKTAGAAGISALGMYVFGSGTAGPLTLYAPYADKLFQEFENPPALIRALNTAGPLQNLLLRRLPEAERAIFRGLLESTAGQTSEMTLAFRPVTGNFLHTLYDDGVEVLKQLLGSQSVFNANADWEAAKTLFSTGVKFVAEELPGKLACAPFLWESYKAFKDSAEALQSHHWVHALKAFIDGAAQMVSMGLLPELSKDSTAAPLPASDDAPPTSKWPGIDPVAPARTQLQTYEAPDVALKDLTKSSSGGPYYQASSNRHFAAIDGKVYAVEKHSPVWQLSRHGKLGPRLKTAANRLIIDPERHIVHYGKAISRMVDEYSASYKSRLMMNIEAQGMRQIRQRYHYKADVLVQAIDIARKYAFYFLHNLALLDPSMPDGRSGNFIRSFFDLQQLDRNVIQKIGEALIPLCNALVDPSDDLLNTDRFIVGSNSYQNDVIAFVLSDDNTNRVHFTEHFFDQQLDYYKTVMSQTFDVDAHAQAATLIHEFAHQFCQALDIRTLRAREPFSDLISLQTHLGTKLYTDLDLYQVTALSRQTPRQELFTEFNSTSGNWIDLDIAPGMEHVGREILAIANAPNMSLARDAFMNPLNPDVRINIILRNADSIARLICELGRQLDPVP